ncbi:hypothetical protein L2E82_23079 [Cichorium intybus]|uniref:Uncharacterized protein n=1 Tax=Cichorium intybus TaxID=13427 RepID=A0ACB9DZJ9_CICIN|nr:hypothetical protein L2E82_23079 [Cichorium intybus]
MGFQIKKKILPDCNGPSNKDLSLQSVYSPLESLLFLEVQASVSSEDGGHHPAYLFLNAGLQSGVLFRTVVDTVTGRRGMLCLSSRPWLGYVHRGHFLLTPLWYETLQYVASFSSDQCAEGVVAVAGDVLWACKIV